jgi:hypothetical protein
LEQFAGDWQMLQHVVRMSDDVVPVTTDGIDSVDALLLTLITTSAIVQQAEPLFVVWSADSHDDAIDARHLAGSHRLLGRLEILNGRLAAAHHSFAMSLVIDSLLPIVEYRIDEEDLHAARAMLPAKANPPLPPPPSDVE